MNKLEIINRELNNFLIENNIDQIFEIKTYFKFVNGVKEYSYEITCLSYECFKVYSKVNYFIEQINNIFDSDILITLDREFETKIFNDYSPYLDSIFNEDKDKYEIYRYLIFKDQLEDKSYLYRNLSLNLAQDNIGFDGNPLSWNVTDNNDYGKATSS